MRRDCGHVVSLCIAVCFCSVVALFCSCAKNQTAHEHDFVENTIVEASCVNEGVVERKCACGYTEIETTNKLPHDYVVEGLSKQLASATVIRLPLAGVAIKQFTKLNKSFRTIWLP